MDDSKVIFLLSQPRAGSTLLQRILANHDEIHTTAEPWLMLHPIYALRASSHSAEYNSDLSYTALRAYLKTLEYGEDHYMAALREMALSLYKASIDPTGKHYFLDKTPRYYYVIPELIRIFPNAQFIFLLRNPLAVLASFLNTWVKDHWVLLSRYRDDLLIAPRQLYEGIQKLEEKALIVHYETLVMNPGTVVSNLCDRLGIAYQPEMVDYGKAPMPRGSMGDATGIDKHESPSTSSLDKWLALGKHRQTRHFADSYLNDLGPDLLANLGYNYDDLISQLVTVIGDEGKVSADWSSLMKPDPQLSKRLVLIELALLEHRRMLHRFRKIKRGWSGLTSLFGRR